MSRKLLINIHLYLAAFFLPFMLLMPFTGVSYLLAEKGSVNSSVAFYVSEAPPENPAMRDDWIAAQFSAQGIDFNWEYVKTNGKDLVLRPSSRDHYVVSVAGDRTSFILLEPNLLLKMIELHKGHGPAWFKKLQIVFGIGMILVTISGIWLSLLSKSLRLKFTYPFIMGTAIMFISLAV